MTIKYKQISFYFPISHFKPWCWLVHLQCVWPVSSILQMPPFSHKYCPFGEHLSKEKLNRNVLSVPKISIYWQKSKLNWNLHYRFGKWFHQIPSGIYNLYYFYGLQRNFRHLSICFSRMASKYLRYRRIMNRYIDILDF